MRWIAFFLVLLSGVSSVHVQETYQTVYAKRKIVQADKNRNGILEKSEVRNAWMQVNVLDQDGDDALRYHSKHSKNLGLNIDMVYSTKGVAVKTINLECSFHQKYKCKIKLLL